MSRTKRRDTYGRTFNEFKKEHIKDFDTWSWYHSRFGHSLKKTLGLYGTEMMNWSNQGNLKKNVKWHANKEQRSWMRNELAVVYRDNEYEVDTRYDHKNHRIWWIYD